LQAEPLAAIAADAVKEVLQAAKELASSAAAEEKPATTVKGVEGGMEDEPMLSPASEAAPPAKADTPSEMETSPGEGVAATPVAEAGGQ
jgi:hypothetical protein